MNITEVKFTSDDLTLEGEWLFPDGQGPFPSVVVSHPFPPGGGSMHNGVVESIWRSLASSGIAAFRFNFRGTGASEGEFDEGVGEVRDVQAALEHVHSYNGIDSNRIGLAGYSFGAMMSAPVAVRDDRVKALALVSAPLSEDQWEKIDRYANPYLVMVGENDHMVDLAMFRTRMNNTPGFGQYRTLEGADHFLNGFESETGRIAAEFFTGIFL